MNLNKKMFFFVVPTSEESEEIYLFVLGVIFLQRKIEFLTNIFHGSLIYN